MLRDKLISKEYLLPDTTPMQTKLLEAHRVSESFQREYCDYMRRYYPGGNVVTAAIRAGEKYTGIENLCVEKDWDLLGDMVYTKKVLGFDYWEYFAYGLRGLTPARKLEFLPQGLRFKYFSKLNTNAKECRVLINKYLCYQRYKEYYKREIIKISGEEDRGQFLEFCTRHAQFVAKPLDDACGKGVQIVDTCASMGIEEKFRELLTTYVDSGKTAFLCEELIVSHPSFSAIHPESVNSLRIVTFFNDIEPRVITAWLKAGCGSAVVDNGSAGGLIAAIDIQTGIVTTPARNEANETFEKHPDTGFPFVGFTIAFWEDAVRIVKEAALQLTGVRIVSWDVALSADKGWQIIEGNAGGMVNLIQVATQKGMRDQFLKDIEWDRYKDL